MSMDLELAKGLLRECIDKYTARLKEPSKRLGPLAATDLLWGIVDRLSIIESMLNGDGEWRKQNRWPFVQRWMEKEKEMQEAAEAAKTATGGLGAPETTKLPSEAEKGHTGENWDIHGAI